MIVALGALHVAPEEDAADVARQHVRVRPAIERKPGRRPLRRILAVGLQNFTGQHVPRLVLAHRFQQPGLPFVGRNVRVRPALHQHQVERRRQVPREMRRREQAVDQPLALVGGRIGEERARFVGRRRHADQVERHAAQEFGVRTP